MTATTGLEQLLASYEPQDDLEARAIARCRAEAVKNDLFSRHSPVHVTGSALVVDQPARKVLLRWHDRLGKWLQVGGHADKGEVDPAVTALREAVEETGLTDLRPWPEERAQLLHVVVVAVPAVRKEPAHEHVDFRYVLSTERPAAIRAERPSAPLRWVEIESAPDEVADSNLQSSLIRLATLVISERP